MQLNDKVAIVTGASRGIGRGIALRLAREGAHVACIARSLDALQSTLAEIQGLGRTARGYAVDVSDAAAVDAAVAQIGKDFEKIDFLINNAGVTRDGLLMRMSPEDWDTVLNTNLKGAFLWTKAMSRIFARQRSGKIVNISSIIGLIGNAGQANYAASKAGLIGFTKSVARELASRGITANAICPGFIETDMTKVLSEEIRAKLLEQVPLRRLGKPEDVAGLVAFLCGPEADYITGQAFTVDGGMVM